GSVLRAPRRAVVDGQSPGTRRKPRGSSAPRVCQLRATACADLVFRLWCGSAVARRIRAKWLQITMPGLLVLPYMALAGPTGNFRWSWAAGLLVLPIALAALIANAWRDRTDAVLTARNELGWRDACVLAVVAALHLLRLLEPAWPYPGLAALPKLYL